MEKEFVIKVTLIVRNGTGLCIIKSKDTMREYRKQGPKHSMLSDNDMAKLLMKETLNELYENEIRVNDTARPKQLKI